MAVFRCEPSSPMCQPWAPWKQDLSQSIALVEEWLAGDTEGGRQGEAGCSSGMKDLGTWMLLLPVRSGLCTAHGGSRAYRAAGSLKQEWAFCLSVVSWGLHFLKYHPEKWARHQPRRGGAASWHSQPHGSMGGAWLVEVWGEGWAWCRQSHAPAAGRRLFTLCGSWPPRLPHYIVHKVAK